MLLLDFTTYPSIPTQLLLSPKELKLVEPFYYHYMGLTAELTDDESTADDNEFNTRFMDLCNQEPTLQRALRLAEKKVNASAWYCILPPVNIGGQNPYTCQGDYYTSDSPDKQEIATNWQEFFFSYHANDTTSRKYFSDLRNSLNLSNEFRYVDIYVLSCLIKMVNIYGPQIKSSQEITQTKQRPYFHSPISKAFREQITISKWGAQGGFLSVGGNTTIYAKITDKNGEPITLTHLDMAIQIAIGNLIEEAGGKPPIIVTPAQIARKVYMQGADYAVSKEDVHTIINALDTMGDNKSYTDFATQLKEHTAMKKQSDYNYSDDLETYGTEEGHLINAIKYTKGTRKKGDIPITWQGEEVKVAYKILDYPPFYRYSHAVGQMAESENKLISSSAEAKAILMDAAKQKKTGLRESALEHSILSNVKYIVGMIDRYPNLHTSARTLAFDDLFDQDELNAMTPAKRRTRIKYIVSYLEYLKRNGEIDDFSPVTGLNNKLTGYVINPIKRTRRRTEKK